MKRNAPRPLSPREGEVLDRLCSGLTNKEIARSLGITNETIKYHMASIMQKLGLSNRVQVALVWMRLRPGYVKMWQVTQEAHLPDDLPPLLVPDAPLASPSEKFWTLVDKRPNEGCWIWEGPVLAHHRPTCRIPGLRSLGPSARRISYALSMGVALPPDLHIRMTCRTLLCVNPRHMRVVGAGTRPEFHRPLGRAYDAYLAGSDSRTAP
jgi:DNA-binding CsgD family transcriptional regulator